MTQERRSVCGLMTTGTLALWFAGGCGDGLPAANNGPLAACSPGQSTHCMAPPNADDLDADEALGTPLPCDVQTLLVEHCSSCHGSEHLYGAPMSLLSWEDLQADAGKSLYPEQAASVEGLKQYEAIMKRIDDPKRPMPQPPNPKLTPDERKVLEDWVSAGAPPRAKGKTCASDPLVRPTPSAGPDAGRGGDGDGDTVPSGPPYWGVEQSGGPEDCETYYEFRAHGAKGEHDTTPYMARGTGQSEGNEYRCFYFKPPWGAEDIALWFQPLIDNPKIIHHWLLYGTDSATQQSGSSAPCHAAEPGAYLLAGWAPGAPTTQLPADIGLQMPTSGLILELHYYNKSGKDQPDHSGVKLCAAKKSARKNTAGISFTGTEGVCIQPNASGKDANPYRDSGGTGGKSRGICDPNDNAGDIHMFRLWPHMHMLGTHMTVTLHRKDPNDPLGSVKDYVIYDGSFDFGLQTTHKFRWNGQEVDEVIFKNGDTMTTECTYENPNSQKVTFGERTQNEMCYGFVWAWPVNTLITNDVDLKLDPINAIGATIQPSRRCLNPTGIFQSCNGFPADYPAFTP